MTKLPDTAGLSPTTQPVDGDPEVIRLLKELVTIESVNPALDPTGAGEGPLAAYIHQWATERGLTARVEDDGSGRPNVIVESRPPAPGIPTLLLCGHLDTVSLASVTDPLLPRVEGDRLYGRGTYDMKAGLAASLVACQRAHEADLPVSVVVAGVADEEHASLGAQRLVENLQADAAIVCEPTEMTVGIAHKGFVWTDIEVHGLAAHGSRPELGVDAIVKTGPILVELERLTESLKSRVHPLLGPASVHASVISGGVEASTIPDRCLLTIERRTLPDESVADVEAELAALLQACRDADSQLNVTARTVLHRPPMQTSPDEHLVAVVGDAIRDALGVEAEVVGMSYWADSAFISALGIPTVLLGPSGEGAHAEVEWVSISETIACADVLYTAAEALAAA
ncbi:M20/M25/M40 family metallo-hydrolase [Blastococcus saxobsidens]|uniref:Acetylornithine deacetylase n=1 Tax=Blastococcus saxobsidens (strain DD2) TaxID=1146883 RepID=H6RMF4_BLASD|nr:M20/M25/M40 family metallo-hydrolase [Blastococcus saxobsidens]CCG02590.1 acetylornithine deacetylase [Blastococcus saxobsidens DD2]